MRQNRRHRRTGIIERLEFRQLLSTYFVDANAPGLTQDGSSWEFAFKDIQAILTSPTLLSGDTVKVADGTYKPTASTDRSVSFNLINGLGVYGGYAGNGATDPNARDTTLYPTILSGDIGTVGTKTDNSYHVISATAVGSTTVLDGVTVKLGYANGSGTNQYFGAGMVNLSGASPTLNNCIFTENGASNLTSGGGICNRNSSPAITNCVFSGNIASEGAGISNFSSSPTVTGCSFSDNKADYNGGGIYNNSSMPTLTDCSFLRNKSGSIGGGAYNTSSSPILTDCTFYGNTSSSGGGLDNELTSSPTLINCVFVGNTASYGRGGGKFNSTDSSSTLNNCTLYGNTAVDAGGAMYSFTATATLTNCIIWNNGTPPIDNYNSTQIFTYCDIQGGFSGTGNINVDPAFVRSPWPGSDGVWGTSDDDYGDLRLLSTSPCLDAGLNSANAAATDIAGNPRIQNNAIDLGAYEGSVLAPAVKTLYVDANAAGNNTGVSWENAFTSLQSALLAAAYGDTIKVADGIYKPTAGNDRSATFAMKNGVSVYGGYAGTGAANPDAQNPSLYPAILSGDIGVIGNNYDNSYHVVTASSMSSTTVLEGFTITLGNANGSGTNQKYGGGMYISSCSGLILNNCFFKGNSASSGGGIYNTSAITLNNCAFVGNTASTNGGGIYTSSSLMLTNCTFIGNSDSSSGGVVYVSPSSLSITLVNCIVWNNGPISNFSSNPALSYSDIQNGRSGVGNINADPAFVRSPWTGSDGVWGTSDDDYGDLRLRSTSPCLNAGLNSANTAAMDIAGNPRVQNNTIDMGAYEGSFDAPAMKTLYVDANAHGNNTGDSWANAFNNLQSALLASADGDTIKVADGTYKPTATTDRSASFVLKNGVSAYGGYAGDGAADPDAQSSSLYPTILSGDIGTIGTNTDNSYHVVTASIIAVTTVLDGFTITLGNANGSGTNQNNGGGMFNVSYWGLSLNNCSFTFNTSSYFGGGLFNSSSLTLTNCTFSNNSSGTYGGGMYNTTSSTLSSTLANCSFVRNTSISGGGLYNSHTASILTNCSFKGNSGVGISSEYSSPTLINCEIVGNIGGGIYSNNYYSQAMINCTIVGNTSSSTGGGINNKSSSPSTLTNCIFWNNGSDPIEGSTATYCDVQGGYYGSTNFDAEPGFVRSPWPGLDSVWGTADDDYGDLRLRSTSPCLDVGLNSANSTSTDIAGNPRIQNSTIDLGAYEGSFDAPAMKTLYVDADAHGNNAGDSWANAFNNLQSALLASADGDTIKVADGTYKPTATSDRKATFTLKNGVCVYGGYAGYGASNPDARNASLYPSNLSGDIGTIGTNTDNSYHVVVASSTGDSTVLDGFTITLGYADGSGSKQNYGGGMLILSYSALSLNNCSFTGSLAKTAGGGIYINSSTPTFTNCSFKANTVNGDQISALGGGIYNDHASPTLSDCSFAGNTSRSGGAGIYNFFSSPSLTNCTFFGNSSLAYGAGYGGGIYNSVSSPTLINCSFMGNLAHSGAGVFNYDLSNPVMTNCTFSGNSASYRGGALYNQESSKPKLTNCIVWDNGSTSIYNISSDLTITYSDIQGGYTGIGNFDADPEFVKSPWPGPDGVWGTSDDQSDLRLRTTSPCLNVGLNSANATSLDLAGNARIQNAVIDLGAYEGDVQITPRTLYVDINAAGDNSGSSWTNAFISLQAAIQAACDNDLIKIADGIYKPTSGTDRSISFVLRSKVSIYGGFAGYDDANPDARNVSLYPTILSGDIGVAGTQTDNSYHVVVATAINSAITLDGVTITLGYASGAASNQGFGGGMFIDSSPGLTLSNCAFLGNAASSGGGIYNNTSSIIFTDCSFTSNTAFSSGGGMYNIASSPSLTNCTFTQNKSTSTSSNTGGGGIFNSSSWPTLANCQFVSNTSAFHGGGIYNNADSNNTFFSTLTNCVFTSNTARYSGGGMFNAINSPQLTNCSFNGNSSETGGGLYNSGSSPKLTNCVLIGNITTGNGAGMYTSGAWPTLTNCLVVGNKTNSTGGGMFNNNSPSTILTNCTFVNNSALSNGGAISNANSSITLKNCILWNNGASIYNSSSTPSITYSDIQGGYSGTGNINSNPNFVCSPWTGPDGVFGTSDDTIDVRLRSDSPCLNVGLNSANATTTDLAGNPRIQNTTIDIGAYEGAFVAPTPKILYVDQSAIGNNSGSSWANAFNNLQAALTAAAYGDTIKIADGIYKPTETADRSISFAIKNDISIYGAYAGYGAANPDARSATLYPTILSGDIGTIGITDDNSYHVVTTNGVSSTTFLDGLTITDGNANGSSPNDSGAGIYNLAGSPQINNCSFTNNLANFAGAGIYNSSSTPTITNCLFTGNYANPGLTSHTGGGGGIYNTASSPVILNCSFLNNKADCGGGGIANIAGSNSIITNSLFVNNTEANWGGAIRSQSSNPIVTNSVFIANSATIYGGAIDCDRASPSFTNCTFYGNTAASGGGVINISTVSGSPSAPTMTNCILWNNSPNNNPTFMGGSITMSYCDIQGGYTGTGNLNADPLFARIPSSGADAKWGAVDDDYGNLRLKAASPCINKGLNSANTTTTDIAGNPRIMNATIDMGAYEASPSTYYVDPNAIGANDGSSWDNAFTSLQSALAVALAEDTLKIADGLYKPTTTTDRTISFNLASGLKIYGAYAGFGAPDPDARSTTLYPTILSGDIGTVGSKTDNSYHVITATSVNSSTILDGLTITLGYANGTGANQNIGAGIMIDSASPSIVNCSFLANSSSSSGGAIYNYSASSPVLTNCVFVGNSSLSSGGAVYNTSTAIPLFINCTFTQNTANSGKALYNYSSNPKLTNCILWNNGSAPIYNKSSSPTITYTDIEGGYTGTSNFNVNPQFVRNASAGPDALWGTADDDYGDLHLQYNSFCINRGLNSANTTPTDLAGIPRILQGTIDMGAYEYQLVFISIPGTSSNDSYVIKYAADSSQLQIWTTPDTSAAPDYSYSISNIQNSSFTLDLADGNDTLLIDLSAITFLRLTLANIENIQLLATENDYLFLNNTQITINSHPISCSGVSSYQLNSPIVRSIYLDDIALKLTSNTFIATLGDAAALRTYLYNASIGAKPSIVCDSTTTLALIDNSKLHKTNFAGTTLSEPFCQVLIQPATPGDANLDGVVNEKDLLSIYANLNKTEATWLSGDVDQSGTVDLADLAMVQSKLVSPTLSLATPKKSSPAKSTKVLKTHKPKKQLPKIHH